MPTAHPTERWAESAISLAGSDAHPWAQRKALRDVLCQDAALVSEIEALHDGRLTHHINRLFNHPYFSYEPRVNDIPKGDEQQGFLESNTFISIAIGGNGSGKTYTAAQRCVDFLGSRPAPTKDTPFWCVGNTYEQVCSTIWHEKLRELIPEEWVDWARVDWYKVNRGWPFFVPMKPGANGNNWSLWMKSYEQGRQNMQANSIGGAWFTEQFPQEIFEEVLRGCREYGQPGCIWAEFTPIDPAKSIYMEDQYDKTMAGDPNCEDWSFFRLNTEVARDEGHVDETWYRAFSSAISDEMSETRLHGAFASYEGQIYKTFNPQIHLVTDTVIPDNVTHKRAIDWGAGEENAFVMLWGFRDSLGCWWIYDEYYTTDQTMTWEDHCDFIKNEKSHWDESDPNYHETYAPPDRPDLFREFAKYGIPCSGANNAVFDGIETVRRLLKITKHGFPRLYIDKVRCPNLARYIKTYRWERSAAGPRAVNPRDAKPQPLKKDDHAPDALRYLVHSDVATITTGDIVAARNDRKEHLAKSTGGRRAKWLAMGGGKNRVRGM